MPKRRPGLKVVRRPGTASLYLRGTVQHQRVFESAGTDDPALAEEKRAVREAGLYRSAVHGLPERVSFAAAAASYLQADDRGPGTRMRLRRLTIALGATIACSEVTQAVLDAVGHRLCRPGSRPASRHREVVTPAKAVLHHAARRGWCAPPMFEAAKAASRRTDWFTPAEAEAMVAAAKPRAAALLTFLFCTGARLGEALALDWATVDLRHSRVVLLGTKNGEDRIIDLPPRAMVMMANLPHRRGPVFLNARKQPYRRTATDKITYGGQIAKTFATTLARAGIERRLTPHHCRHTWASWHYCVHKDLVRLREDGCWKTVAMCERYTKLVPNGLAPEILKFWGSRANEAQDAPAIRETG